MNKRLALLASLFSLWITLAAHGEEQVLQVEQLVQEATERNPRIIAARESYAALKEKIPQAGAFEDPMLGFGVINVPESLSFNEEGMTMKEISVTQKVPFPGKRSLSRTIAAREADAGEAEIAAVTNEVVRDVKTTFYDLSHVYRATEVTRRNKKILEELSRITQTRYSLGKAVQEDVVRTQVEISRMVDDLIMLEQKKRSLAARMNYLLNRPQDSPMGQPAELDFKRAAFSIEELQQLALEKSPMLQALKQNITAREKNVALARRDYISDFGLKFAYGQREDRVDMYTGMIEMNLPVFAAAKQNRRVEGARADVRSAKASYDSVKNEILYMVVDMGSMVQRRENGIGLYRTGILPQARLQIDAAMSAYMVNKADFMTLLDSRMRLYRYELEYHDALTEYEKNLAALEAVVGSPIPREEKK